MPSEVIRCVDCGTPIRSVPSWLTTANVNFTCGNCPRKTSRATRFEAAPEPRTILAGEADPDLEVVDLDEIDEDADLEVGDDLDETKDDKDL